MGAEDDDDDDDAIMERVYFGAVAFEKGKGGKNGFLLGFLAVADGASIRKRQKTTVLRDEDVVVAVMDSRD